MKMMLDTNICIDIYLIKQQPPTITSSSIATGHYELQRSEILQSSFTIVYAA